MYINEGSRMTTRDVEDIFIHVANVILENRELKQENEYLKEKVQEHRAYIDKRHRDVINQQSNILSKALGFSEEEESND